MRELILAEIARLAKDNDGAPPGVQAFATATGITQGKWRGVHWARWSDALAEAGFAANHLTSKLDSTDILAEIGALARLLGRLPSNSDIRLHKRTNPRLPTDKTVTNHFGAAEDVRSALRKYAEDIGDAELLALIPPQLQRQNPANTSPIDGYVYLMKSGHFYKTGRSDNIARRISEIRIALPENVELIHSIRTDDPPGIEAYWHRRFVDKRKNGDWFELSPADVKAFLRRTYQ